MGHDIVDVAYMAVAGLGTLCMLHLLLRFGSRLPQDVPNERSLHAGCIPRVGGLAMWAGGGIAVLLAVLAGRTGGNLSVIGAAAGALALLSFFDDRRGLPVALRMLAHLAAATWVASALPLPLPIAACLALALALAWMANLYNFMDGSDGLAGGMTLAGFATYGIAAWPWDHDLALFSVIVAAAAAGFLVFNFHPARTFMGDAGSIPLGFMAGGFGLAGWQAGIWPAWFPVLVFSPFIVDASVTLMRRAMRRERVWQAHRDHYYQRLVRMGWGHRRTALAEYGVMLAAGGSALILMRVAAPYQWVGIAALAAIYAGLAWRIDKSWAAKAP